MATGASLASTRSNNMKPITATQPHMATMIKVSTVLVA
jgi:hypothetical protein